MTLVCSPNLTPSFSNKFWSKISTPNQNAKKGLALHALSWINLHTLYSLHSLWFLWTIIFIGNPCYLSNWRMWYDWMNGTMLFLAKYLGFLFKKKMPWLVSSNYNFLPRPKLDFHDQTLICSLTLLWVLSNSLTLFRDLSYSHDQDHIHIHSHAILLPLEDSKNSHPLTK